MNNCSRFSSTYLYSNNHLKPIDELSLINRPRICLLYSLITRLLGFTPNKHEGKITGLAAFGTPTQSIISLLEDLLLEPNLLNQTIYWKNEYSNLPLIISNNSSLADIQSLFTGFTRQDIAASLQSFVEKVICDYYIDIYDSLGSSSPLPLLLSGGLFSNVKVTKSLREAIPSLSIQTVPAMTDDGTALGCAFHSYLKNNNIGISQHLLESGPTLTMPFFGISYSSSTVIDYLSDKQAIFKEESPIDCSLSFAQSLIDNKIGCVVEGSSEFGPRALCHRSILANASSKAINEKLNSSLMRSDFMPFAPIFRIDDLNLLVSDFYDDPFNLAYMSTACNASTMMIDLAPASVHVDNTMRPQVIFDILRLDLFIMYFHIFLI